MDFVETVLLRKAGRGRDMLSSAAGRWHHQHQQSPLPPSSAEEEEPCAATDRGGGLLWEDFSVDDLLDLGGGGGGKEQNGGAEGEGFLQVGEVEEEEEERAGWCNSNASPSASALSFQAAAFLPSSSDPIVPTQAGDVEDLEWVSRFVDDSYSEFASAALAPPFASLYAPAPPAPAAAAEAGAAKAWSTSSGSPLKRPWRSSCFSTASVAVPARARSKRSRTGGRVWSLRGPSLLSEPSSSSCSSASSSSSCSVFSSVTSSLGAGGGNPDRFLHSLGGGPLFLNQRELPQLQVTKKKTGRKPKVPAGGGGGGAEQETRRRCSHCGVDKTPQWRAGPMGTKTLCNACGVRYKSGRLLPEYRPAGSPTFLSHIHSNSHRKVLEIRRSKEVLAGGDAASCSPSPSQQVVEATRPYGVV